MGSRTHRNRGRLAVVGVAAAALAIAACTPVPPGGGTTTTSTTTTIATPTPPVITTFSISGTVGPAPSLVALAWSVSDPNGDPLTCRLDGDGDGTPEVIVTNCPSVGSRNVSYPVAGNVVAHLEVDDGNSAPVAATVPVSVPTGPSETFDIELRGLASLTPAQSAAFTAAESRWEGVILRGIADTASAPRPPCLPAASASLPAIIDDVIIDVSVVPIDGAGGILGQAGPTCINSGTELSTFGAMEFDQADVVNLLASGSFSSVILHEMGHVLGFGTLWDLSSGGFGVRKVISGAGGPDPRFTGPRAIAALSTLGGGGSVPVEATGGAGTRDSHWRETTFGNELMTGWLNPGTNPLSRLSLASLADLGYQVDLGAADPYTVPSFAALFAPSARAAADVGTMLRPPLGAI